MVQEKDAAKKRHQRRQEWLKQEQKRYRDSVIQTEWVVVETTPAYNTGGYYDTDVPEKNVIVADGFSERSEAVDWMDRHEADKGNLLRVGHRDLRQITYKEWTGVFYERNNNG